MRDAATDLLITSLLLISSGILLAIFAAGCGGTLGPYVEVGDVMQTTAERSEVLIRELRSEAMLSAAREVHDAGGDREAADRAAIAASVPWECAVSGQRVFAGLARDYVLELALAHAAEDAQRPSLLQRAVRYAGSALDAYRATASCVNALRPETLPAAPGFLSILPPAWGVE